MAIPRIQQQVDPKSSVSPRLRLYRNDSVELETPAPLLEDFAPAGVSLGDFLYPDVVARQACFWGGLVFSCIGSIEFFFPAITGVVSSRYHAVFYLVTGALLVLPALVLAARPLARVSVALGVLLAALGFLGFLMGSPPEATLGAPVAIDRFQWVVSAGNLEFGTRDHVLQEVVGLVLLLVGVGQRRRETGKGFDGTPRNS